MIMEICGKPASPQKQYKSRQAKLRSGDKPTPPLQYWRWGRGIKEIIQDMETPIEISVCHEAQAVCRALWYSVEPAPARPCILYSH